MRVAQGAVDPFAFDLELSEPPLAVQAKRIDRLGDGKEMRSVLAVIAGNGDLSRQRRTDSKPPAERFCVLRAIHSSGFQENLGLQFLLTSPGHSRLGNIFQIEVERAAAQHVGLVADFGLSANIE